MTLVLIFQVGKGINIIKDFFYFQAIKSSDSKLKFVGGIQVNF